MYFKRLELIGFKSFADKTTIEFEHGVTAVVGPNGCGKSNISDAIRWVLGEQSAKSLRGASMEDIIFNGSAAKEPLNLAEVSLTLSNEAKILPIEYDEVTITRRLYRSGESEYLLNKNTVRLRDIHELLMGTGIGTESYSIIEQGKMDIVLNAKPEDRRTIFEEAAGITKFKSQKKEALRKLEQTDQNLLRVNDIVQEVKRQIGSIERQARKAENYKSEFEKLKSLELSVASREFLLFEDNRRKKEDDLDELRSREKEYHFLVESLERQCADQRLTLERIEESLASAAAEELSTGAEIRKNHDRVLLNRERIGELLERRENLLRQIETAKRRIGEFRTEFDGLNTEFERTSRDEAEGLAFLSTVEAEFSAIERFIAESLSGEEAAKTKLADLSERKSTLQKDLAKINAELASLSARVRRLRQEEQTISAEQREAARSLESALAVLSGEESVLNEAAGRKAERERAFTAASEDIRSKQNALNAVSLEASAAQSKRDVLKDLQARHEGLLGGVKALLEEKNSGSGRTHGMVGLLADLLKVEPGYELAVEAALENFLQAVVFETDTDVLGAAKRLRELKKGRALLLSLEYRDTVPQASSPEGRNILDFIQAEPRIRALVSKLVANALVIDDPARAFDVSRAHSAWMCVTREGERFEGQVVRGGSIAEQAEFTLVGRESRITGLEEELASLVRRRTAEEAALESARAAHTSLEADIRAAASGIEAMQNAIAEKKSGVRLLEDAGARLSAELSKIAAEVAELAAEETRLLETERSLNENSFILGEEDKRLGAEILGLRSAAREKSTEKETLLVKLAETRSKQAHFTSQREKIEKDRHWVLESVKNEEIQLVLHEAEIAETGVKKEALETENAALETAVTELTAARDAVLRRVEAVRREKEEAALRLHQIEKERGVKQEFLNGSREKTHALELENAQLRFDIDRLKERIYNAYQVDLLVQAEMAHSQAGAEEAITPEGREFDMELAKAEIQSQKDRIAKMGPVNLVAIQEYDEMKQRYDFLAQQQADLVQAKEDLHKAILKINRTTRELFTETFEKVRGHFTEYYRQLFGGGSAELVLLDEENVLESGIEIVARPPGKKLQSITLLSGGEKALTAVALLFALFKVKPSPFCVLDEIDAPLDETNVDRFCNVLREFITGSQFILITHNKRTMNLADAMYGITMAETGISKLVSVRFSDRRPASRKDKEEVLV